MISATEALRQCLEAMKLVDFKDCAESEELWHKFNLAQANAERVLRDGEKQEPLGYLRQSEIAKMADPRVSGVGMMLHKDGGEGKVAVYTSPAPSLQAVEVVPEGWRERLLQEMAVQEKHYGEVAAAAAAGSQLHKGERDCTEGVIMGVEYCIAALDSLAAAPQPAAAPSGDVERAAKVVLSVALDEARGRVHICDADNDDIKAKTLSEEMQALYAAITATKEENK